MDEDIIESYENLEKIHLVEECTEEVINKSLCELHYKIKVKYGGVELEKFKLKIGKIINDKSKKEEIYKVIKCNKRSIVREVYNEHNISF